MLKRFLALAVLILGSLTSTVISTAQVSVSHANVLRKPLEFRHPIQDKNFYLLSLLETSNGVANALASDPQLVSLANRKAAIEVWCGDKPTVCVDAASFRSEEIAIVKRRLLNALRTIPEVKTEVVIPMRQSGLFELYALDDDSELVSRAWSDAARGINRILEIYGKGESPRYSQIDSASFDLQSPVGKKRFGDLFSQRSAAPLRGTMPKDHLWFQPSLKLALLLLSVNHRDEAGRYEPLEKGENAAALARLSRIRWSEYAYSAIVVPGLGPEDPGVALDPGARKRIELAATNFRKGLAPYILVSGGNVHPSQTPFCEAIEMKKALIQELKIPADAILVEPQARHTTTNLRNASRLLYRYGFPLDLPALVTSDETQTSSIVSPDFALRNQKELGYLPFRNLKPLSSTDTAFNVEIDSLQADSSDPLDP